MKNMTKAEKQTKAETSGNLAEVIAYSIPNTSNIFVMQYKSFIIIEQYNIMILLSMIVICV
jgi:hypothetical protein